MTPDPSPGLLTFGEVMARIAADQVGLLDDVRSFGMSLAGAEANVAIAASRLGARVTWAGRLGTDSVGDMITRRLRREGVQTRLTRDSGFTGLLLCTRRTASTTRIDYHRAGSAGSRLTVSDLGEELVRRADLLHVTGITSALSATARQTTAWAVETARTSGVPVSVDVNYRTKLWSPREAAPVLRDLVVQATIVFAGREEAGLVLGVDCTGPASPPSIELARGLAALGPTEAVIKDGARGCAAVMDGVEHALDAVPVESVDPVGAGDAFVAGYLVERMAGGDGASRLRLANRMGAFAVTVPGDCEGLPTRAELEAFANAVDVLR